MDVIYYFILYERLVIDYDSTDPAHIFFICHLLSHIIAATCISLDSYKRFNHHLKLNKSKIKKNFHHKGVKQV